MRSLRLLVMLLDLRFRRPPLVSAVTPRDRCTVVLFLASADLETRRIEVEESDMASTSGPFGRSETLSGSVVVTIGRCDHGRS